MSVPAEKVTDFKMVDSKLRVNVGVVSGRIVSSRKFDTQDGKRFEHLLVLPAPDSFSSPQSVIVVSDSRLGEKGEDVTVKVSIGGFRRSYKVVDKDTGEQVTRVTADNRLIVVD